MDTGVVTIQEPVSTKTNVGEAPAGVIFDHSSMDIHKVNLSAVLDDEITSGDRRNNIIPGEADVVNGSGNKETEELKPEKGEATKTISAVDDCSKIVNDDQDSVLVHEPQSFNKTTEEDDKIILSGVTLEKKKEDDITRKPEEVCVEKPVIEDDQTDTKHSTEQEEEIYNISKDSEDIPIETDEVTGETDSRTVETSVNGTEAKHNATVSAEQILRNGDNIVNETVSEDQNATNGVETTKNILLEVKKEDEEAEPLYKPVVENANIVSNEETTAHESKSLNGDNHQEENAEPVEAIKNSDDISREVTVDKEKEEDITPKTEEVQESPRVIETLTIQGEDIVSKASLDHEDTEEHENVLVRDIPQGETLVTEAKTVDTSTVQEAEILKTNINETEAHSAVGGEKEGQEIEENTKPSQDLKDDKELQETETVKTIISSDEVGSSDVQAEVYGEHTEPCSSEIKDESHGREESIEVNSKETVPEKETATEVEKEEDKEEMKIDEEPIMNAIKKAETVTIKTVIEDPKIVNNEETTVHESESLKENAEPVEAIKYSDDAEKISRETEGHITKNTEEVQESLSVIETSKIQGENIESKASPEPKEEVDHSSNETEEHEHLLRRDLQQCDTLEVETVETKPSLDLKEETETVKNVISSDEVRSSAVQEEEIGEHTEPCSSEIKDESHRREESVEIKAKETVQDESTMEKHEDLLDVPSTESEKYQDYEPETTIVANTESHEKFEESPDLAFNVDKKIKVDQVDGTQIMEEQRGLDSNGVEAEQIDQNRTDDTEESPVAKQVSLPEVEPVEQMQKPSLESPSQVSEETSKTVAAKIDDTPEEEKVTHQEDQEEGSYDGLETKEDTISVPDSSARSVIDLTPLQEESSEPNEQKEETKLEKSEPTNEEVKSDEVIEVSSASLSKELEGETVVEAEKIENKKDNEEETPLVDSIQKSLETVETVESHSSLPSSSEEQGTVSEKIEDEKEEPMVQIKSHVRQEEVSKDVEEEQTIDIEPPLTEKCSKDHNQPEEQVEEACSIDEQEKEILSNSEIIVNEKYALHSTEAAEEETATNGETKKNILLEVEKEEEEAEIKTDVEPRLDAIKKEEIETAKTVVEDIEIVKKEEATAHESETLKGDDHQGENEKSVEAFKNSDEAAKVSSEVAGDRENEEDITQKAEEVQENPRVIEIPTIQGEDNESKASLELKEEVDQSSKDREQLEHVLERDIPQCETLEAEAVDTSTVQEAAILNTLETNISETEAVHSEMSLDPKVEKEQKEAETVKTVILSDEVRPFVQVDGQAEEFGENTEPCTSEIKDESQGKEESVEVKSMETVQDVSSEEKGVNLLEVRSEESEKYQENEPVTSLVPKIESGDKFEESVGTTHSQTLVDVVSVEKVQTPSLETLSELSEETSKSVHEKIEDKPIEEVTLHQEGQEEGSNGLETNEETVSVPESRELGEKPQEEESCLQNEQEKELELQKEQVDKHEPIEEEVSNDQQSPVEEKSHEVIQVSPASPLKGQEDDTVAEAEKIGEEQVADKNQKVSETAETSSLPSSSEEQEHVAVPEKTDGEEVKETEPIGDMRERGLEIAETTHLILPSADQKDEVKAFDEKTQIPSVILPSDEQEKVTSTEKGETKANETEDDKPDEDVDSSTSPLLSEKNDDETQIAEVNKGDEEITVGTSKTSENVSMQQEEFEKLEATKLEELKEDKSQEIAETPEVIETTSDQSLPIKTAQPDDTPSYELVSEQDDQTPKQVEEIYEEEHKVEANGDRNLPVETSQAYQTTSSDLVSALNDQTPKQVEETHEKQTMEEQKIQAEEIVPTKTIPRELSDDVLVSMLASKEDGQVTLQEDNCADDVRETKDTQEERPVSVEIEESVGETKPKEPEDEMRDEHVETPTSSIILEKNDNDTQISEAKKGDEDINETEATVALGSSGTLTTSENMCLKQEEFVNPEAPKLEESKEEKVQEVPDTSEAIEATGDQTLSIETSQEDQTLSSELLSGLGDQTPSKVEEIHEEERKFEATGDQSLQVETSQEYRNPSSDLASGLDGQTPQQVEEVHEEETKEEQKSQVAVEHILPVETSQADQTPSLVSENEDQTSKQVEEILEEETKETQKVQAEEIVSTETVPRESFSEAPVSLLTSREDEPVPPQEGICAGDTQVEQHVSAETEEREGETKPKESEAQGTEKSDDQVETSTKLTKVEDESTKKTDVEVAELTNDYPTEEAEHGDESYSTLPVVGILTELQTTLETERAINDSASSGGNVIIETAEKVPKTNDAEVESNEKDSAAGIIEANMLQHDESGENEKNQEENGLAGKSLPVEKLTLQEDDKEEVKVQDVISREFEVSIKEKLQEEETREIAEKQEESKAQQDASLQEEHPRDFEVSKKVADNSHKVIGSELPADQPQAEQKTEIHENFKEEVQIVDFNEVRKSEEVQDEKLGGLSATTDTEQKISSEVKKDQEYASELGVGHDFASLQVEKVEEPHSLLGNDEEINEVVTLEKQITDPVVIIKKAEHESNEEHFEPQAISDDIKSNSDRGFPTEEAPKDQREEVNADKSLTEEALEEEIKVPSSALLEDQDLSVQKPSELIQSHQSPNQIEEASFEVKKTQEDKNKEAGDELIINENVQVQDQPKDFDAPAEDKQTSVQEQKSKDFTDVQEDTGTNFKPEVRNGHDSVVALKEESGLIEEKREVENVKAELEDAIKREVSVEEENNTSEKIDHEAAKDIYQEESKQTYTVKEEIKEKEKETNQESFNNVKKADDAIDKTKPETVEIKSLSSDSKIQDKSEHKDEVPNQQEREIADEVPKLENPKIAEELQQKGEESESTKDLFSEVKETEPTLKEPARKSLSDLIQKVKGTKKTEDATTEPHIEEEPKTVEEDENEDGDHEHEKDDKTSPDSIVMVEAKDTVSIIKTHKKSQGILSGVGSKVKHSISKVKKVLTGKSSHTTKPSSPT